MRSWTPHIPLQLDPKPAPSASYFDPSRETLRTLHQRALMAQLGAFQAVAETPPMNLRQRVLFRIICWRLRRTSNRLYRDGRRAGWL